MAHTKNKTQMGFSFIELMAVVAIVGVLTAIAYPSYIKSVQKSNRTDAKTELADLSQRLQRCFTVNGTYAPAAGTCLVKDDLIGANGVVTRGKFYVVKASNVAATTYTLTATPVSGSVQENDKECATFVLDNKGQKSAKNSSSADTTNVCW